MYGIQIKLMHLLYCLHVAGGHVEGVFDFFNTGGVQVRGLVSRPQRLRYQQLQPVNQSKVHIQMETRQKYFHFCFNATNT